MNLKTSKSGQYSISIIDVRTEVILTLAIVLLSVFSLNAQTTPEPPKPPKTTSSKTYSTSMENEANKSYSSSISISKSDDSYKFKASYHKSKNEGVKAMLLDELGRDNLSINGNTYLWTDKQHGDDVFECKLTKGHVRMYVNIEVASKGFTEKINRLGNALKHYVSGTDHKKEKADNVEAAKRKLEKAERRLERAKRELEHAKREAKQVKGN